MPIVELTDRWILTALVLLILWTGVGAYSIFISRRTMLYGLLIIAGGVFPKVIFYTYAALDLWDGIDRIAIVYARVADFCLVLSLWLSLRAMFKITTIKKRVSINTAVKAYDER